MNAGQWVRRVLAGLVYVWVAVIICWPVWLVIGALALITRCGR